MIPKAIGDPPANINHPVIHVSWNDAIAYCNWLSDHRGFQKVYTISGAKVSANWKANGYRLPTEAEWEYAARSKGKDYKYAWGNGEPHGNIGDEKGKEKYPDWIIWENYNDGYETTAPVGSFKQGDLGITDMTGNVYEWCWDWYASAYYNISPNNNPTGPETGSYRVIRGGSGGCRPVFLRCTYRSKNSPANRSDIIGFRLARVDS